MVPPLTTTTINFVRKNAQLGTFYVKAENRVQAPSLPNLHQLGWSSLLLPSPGRNLTSALTCQAGLGLPGALYFPPITLNQKSISVNHGDTYLLDIVWVS